MNGYQTFCKEQWTYYMYLAKLSANFPSLAAVHKECARRWLNWALVDHWENIGLL